MIIQVLHCETVRLGHIHDMDVITYRAAVRGVIVGTEYLQFR